MNVNFEAIEKAWFKPKKNVLDELEEWLKRETMGLYDSENPLLLDESFIKYATERKMAYMYVLDKIQELKKEMK